jgi:hypothetical protein
MQIDIWVDRFKTRATKTLTWRPGGPPWRPPLEAWRPGLGAPQAAGQGRPRHPVRDARRNRFSELVKQQASWQTENTQLGAITDALGELAAPTFTVPKLGDPSVPANQDLFTVAANLLQRLETDLADKVQQIDEALSKSRTELGQLREQWNARHRSFNHALDQQLHGVEQGASLVVLRSRLESLQARSAQISHARN